MSCISLIRLLSSFRICAFCSIPCAMTGWFVHLQTRVCSRNCSLNLCFRCVEDSVNDSKNRAAHCEDSSVQQVRSLQSRGKYKPIVSRWILVKPVIPLCGSDTEIKSERLLQRQREMCTETAPLGTEPGNMAQERVLNWFMVWGIWHMCNNSKNENPHVLLFLVILQCCRREGQKAVAGVNIWTRRVRIRKTTRRRQL